jgi:hypothetical protein
MARDFMTRCEQRKRYKVGDDYELRWKEVPVSDVIAAAAAPRDLRCAQCHGAVRVHQQHVEDGPQDHVEHRLRRDSEGCRGGHYFQGEHRESSQPVV